MTDYKPFLNVVLDNTEFDQGQLKHVALKAVNPDFTTRNGFQWAFPDRWTRDPADTGNYSPNLCPTKPGDGLSVAKTVAGMASGGYSPVTVLIVGFSEADLLQEADNKIKIRKAKTLAVVDGLKLIRNHGKEAYLARANLARAYLGGAYLEGANLEGANLARANLARAYLGGAYLEGANLEGANLEGANLARAYLGSHSVDNLRTRGAIV
jgi:uncharacterized protein YjbI with pentapeptide repeats